MEWYQTIWNNAKSYFTSIWSEIKNIFGSVASWFGDKFRNAWNSIKNVFSGWGSFFGGLWNSIKSKFSSIGSTLGSTMSNAVKTGMNSIIVKIESIINKGIGLINSAIRLANKLPGINVGKLGTLRLPRLAEGGVLKRGQISILEGKGAEVVVPLEKNTEWIDKVAAQFEERTGNLSSKIMIERINRVISLLEQMIQRDIYLDSGVLVGELASGIDARLGDKYKHIQRGNTR